jgi:hypothetical protein
MDITVTLTRNEAEVLREAMQLWLSKQNSKVVENTVALPILAKLRHPSLASYTKKVS